jgi:hypothetical protein
MDHFPNLEGKSIRDVPYGSCIVFAMEDCVCVGITLQPHPPTHDETIAVLWTSRKEPSTPRIISVASTSGDEVVAFPAAKVLLPIDPTHIRFRYRERAEPHGALFLANGEPHVLVRGLIDGSVAVRLRDGIYADIGISNLPWFPSWAIAMPDTNGRWTTMCNVEWKREAHTHEPV